MQYTHVPVMQYVCADLQSQIRACASAQTFEALRVVVRPVEQNGALYAMGCTVQMGCLMVLVTLKYYV